MPERPLLLFPRYDIADRTTHPFVPPPHHCPNLARQIDRLTPMFNELQQAFAARHVELQASAAGADPEEVLVIETVGSVQDFVIAVRHLPGLEWLGEVEIDEIAPDEDFYYDHHRDRPLDGRLYFVMSNQHALNEMLSLWNQYCADPSIRFHHGLANFKHVFRQLRDIHRWGVEDRLRETGLIDSWREDLQANGADVRRFEAELWFRESAERRQASQDLVGSLVERLGGRVLGQCVIGEIAYHGLLGELPADAIRAIVDDPNVELVKCDDVMFFRPVAQMTVGENPTEGEFELGSFHDMPSPAGEPIIALLDGFPLANHRLLANRLFIDDPDDWEAAYPPQARNHGTAMASLILHGDLSEQGPALARPIYVRPIMKPAPDSFRIPPPEEVPHDLLVVDLIHTAVRRILEGEGKEPAAAPRVRIINLSIGDRGRQFTQLLSPLARLLDWLSYSYGVLFIVSAGNHPRPIALGLTQEVFESMNSTDREQATVAALYRDVRNRRLLSPGESLNALTVGAVHQDSSIVLVAGNRFDPFEHALPSPVSSFGGGFRRAVKPDVLGAGGRQWYRLPLQPAERLAIEPADFRTPPGNKVASPSPSAGELSATTYLCGTSNATALTSRAAGFCYESLRQLMDQYEFEIDARGVEAPMLKAMLVHTCSWEHLDERVLAILAGAQDSPMVSDPVTRWMGYGILKAERALSCTDQRATLLGFGHLTHGQAHIFSLPLPPSLAFRRVWRRITTTLAWLSPTCPRTQRYRGAELWVDLIGNDLAPTRSGPGYWAARRGTVQHGVFEDQTAVPFADGASIALKVNCRKDAGEIPAPVAYGLVVSLEVAEGVDIAVYDEIRARIATPIAIATHNGAA